MYTKIYFQENKLNILLYNNKLGYSLKCFCSLWPHCPKNTLITNFWRGLQKTTIKWRRIKECIVTFKPHRSLSQSMDMLFFNTFHLMTFPYDAVRVFRFIFCVYNIFPMFSKSCVKVSVCSSYIKFVLAGACHCLTVLFCLRLYYSYCYLFCRLFLSTFLLIHCPVR